MRLVFGILMLVFLVSCGDEKKEDTQSNAEENEINSKVDLSKIEMIDCEAQISWERDKKLTHAEANFKIGDTDVDLNINNLSLSTEGEFTVTSATYYEQKGAYHAIVKVDLSQLKALQKDNNDHLSMIGPNYLDTDQFPTASINLTHFNGDKGDEGLAILHIKDQDIMAQINYDYSEDDQGFKYVKGTIVLDAVAAGLINPDVIQEIEKDEITINIELNR